MYINIKSKYKKIFWLLLGFLACCMLTEKAFALDSFTMGNGTVINQEYIQNLWDTYINGKTPNDISSSSSTDPLYTKQYEKGVFNDILIYPLDNNRIYIGWFDKSQIQFFSETSTTIQFQFDNPNTSTGYRHSPSMNFNTSTNTVQSYFSNYPGRITINKNNPAHQCNVGSGFKVCYNNFDLIYNDTNYLSNNFNFSFGPQLPDYLTGYKKITLTTDDKYYMLSGLSSGSVYIPTSDFEEYGGRLSYYDNDLSSQPYTSYIQDYYKMPDGNYIRQDFDLSQFYGADWVMFSKYIYLEGEDNISYDIYVPNDIYDSEVVITPNPNTGGNDFDFDYKDSNGDIQNGQVQSIDLSQDNPLLGNIFSDFSSNTFGLTSIISAPLSLIRSLSSTSCTPLNLPLPFVGGTLTLPCMYSFYENTFGTLFNLYQTITFGIISYWVIVRIFNLVKDFKNPDHDEIEVIDL